MDNVAAIGLVFYVVGCLLFLLLCILIFIAPWRCWVHLKGLRGDLTQATAEENSWGQTQPNTIQFSLLRGLSTRSPSNYWKVLKNRLKRKGMSRLQIVTN